VNVAIFLVLRLFLGRNVRAALGTVNHRGESEIVRLRSRFARTAEHTLDAVVFRLGDDRFVDTFVPNAASYGVLEAAAIERTSEDYIDRASA
jgi:hypothetical protein